MQPEHPRPTAQLVRFAVFVPACGVRSFLRHAWMEFGPEEPEGGPRQAVFEAALTGIAPLPFGKAPWSWVLARALRRTARLFADRGLAMRFSDSKAGADFVPALDLFAPLCGKIDGEIEEAGFDFVQGETEAVLRDAFCRHVPEAPEVPALGAAKLWLPDFFSGVMQASFFRELVSEPKAMAELGETAAALFRDIFEKAGLAAPPNATELVECVTAYAPKSVEYALGQIAWLLDPDEADDLVAKTLPFLRASFARETPPPPVLPAAKAAPEPTPPVETLPPPMLATVPGVPGAATRPRVLPRPWPPKDKAGATPPPVVPVRDLDDADDAPRRDFRVWMVGIVVGAMMLAALWPFLQFDGGGAPSSAASAAVENIPTPPAAPAAPTAPEPPPQPREEIVVREPELLPEPSAAIPIAPTPPRLMEDARRHVEAAVKHRDAGRHRDASEELSHALLIYKEHWGDSRWREPLYQETRAAFRAALALMDVPDAHIARIEEVIGAREPAPEPAQNPQLAPAVAAAAKGDAAVAQEKFPEAAAHYEAALQEARTILGPACDADLLYQRLLSKYLDFLIARNLPPEVMHARIALVKSGGKPGPLPKPDEKKNLEDELGLPRL